MVLKKWIGLCACLLLLLSAFRAQGQLNIRVGYNLGYLNPTVHNQIYQQYSEDHPWLGKPLSDLSTLSGLQLGLRYSFADILGIELTWYNQYHRRLADGINPADDSDFFQKINFRYSSLGLGLENFIGKSFSYGASLDYDLHKIFSENTNQKKLLLSRQNGWSSHFFLAYNFKGNNVLQMSIRPYAHISWTLIDLANLNQELNPGHENENLLEDYSTFGVMLVFYNGQ